MMSQPVSPSLISPAAPAAVAAPDFLRGLVVVLMALDHVRDFFTNARFDPLDLSQTTATLFLTRCAAGLRG